MTGDDLITALLCVAFALFIFAALYLSRPPRVDLAERLEGHVGPEPGEWAAESRTRAGRP